MPRRIIRIVRLDIHVAGARLIDKRRRCRSHELILRRDNNREIIPRLHDRRAVVQTHDRCTGRTEVAARGAADDVEDVANKRTRQASANIGEIVEAAEGSAVRGWGNGDDLVDEAGDAFEFGDVKALEGTLGMADDVELGGACAGLDGLHEGGDLGSGRANGHQASNPRELEIVAVGEGEGAETFLLEVLFKVIQVFVISCAQAVEHHNGVGVGGAFAEKIIVNGHAVFAIDVLARDEGCWGGGDRG